MVNAAPLWCVLVSWWVWGILYWWLGPLARVGRGRAVQAPLPGAWAWLDRGLMALTSVAGGAGGLYILGALRGWFRPPGYWLPSGLVWVLASLFALGLALTVWGKVTLGPNFVAGSALKVEHALVAEGPYAWIRHPIYAGMLIMCATTGVLSGMWLVLALGAGLAPACYGLRIWLDERLLQTGFGPTYAAYARRVPMLVPRVRSAKQGP